MKSEIRDLIESVRQEQKLPDILGERCVHGIIETASCRSCVDSCPQGAWLLDDDALRLNTDACDGCGLCMPACPERAIHISHEIVIGRWQDSSIAMCACEYTLCSETEGVLPCIHSIGLQEILRLYNQGVIQWGVMTADCNSCARGKGTQLSERVDVFNRSLQVSRQTEIRLKSLSLTQWQRLHKKLAESALGPQLSRRGFLSGLVSASARQGMELFGLFNDEQGSATSAGQLLPHSTKAVWPCLPVIESIFCNGCDACVRLCPHDAIRLDMRDEQAFYQLNPKDCTGCNICVDICEQQAIKLYQWRMQDEQEIALVNATCSCCGNPFHFPSQQSADMPRICRICSKCNHNKKLYQVLSAEQ